MHSTHQSGPVLRAALTAGVPLWRLNLLRVMFLVWFLAGLIMALPPLVAHDVASRGMVPSMLAGLWVMSILGIRYPLQMLPIFLFEMAWKTLWLMAFGLPQWFGWTARSPRLQEDLLSIGRVPSFSPSSYRGAMSGTDT